jgi:hypothetical protein
MMVARYCAMIALLGVAALADDKAMKRAIADEQAQFDRLTTVMPPFAALGGSTTVRCNLVKNRTQELGRNRPLTGNESFGLPGRFRIVDPPVALSERTGNAVREVLVSPSSYDAGVYSTCVFAPAVALTFPTSNELMALVCFSCREVAFTRSTKLLGKWMLRDDAVHRLLGAAREAFPGLAEAPSKGSPQE